MPWQDSLWSPPLNKIPGREVRDWEAVKNWK
jgi:hypothetical protein